MKLFLCSLMFDTETEPGMLICPDNRKGHRIREKSLPFLPHTTEYYDCCIMRTYMVILSDQSHRDQELSGH